MATAKSTRIEKIQFLEKMLADITADVMHFTSIIGAEYPYPMFLEEAISDKNTVESAIAYLRAKQTVSARSVKKQSLKEIIAQLETEAWSSVTPEDMTAYLPVGAKASQVSEFRRLGYEIVFVV